jgi:hypothetical protein
VTLLRLPPVTSGERATNDVTVPVKVSAVRQRFSIRHPSLAPGTSRVIVFAVSFTDLIRTFPAMPLPSRNMPAFNPETEVKDKTFAVLSCDLTLENETLDGAWVSAWLNVTSPVA